MAPNVGALCRGASWPTDPGARRSPPGRHGGGAPAGLRIPVPVVARLDDTAGGASWPTDPGPGSEGGSLVPPGAGPGPRTCSTRFRSGAYSANRGKQGRSWPGPTSLGPLARTRTPGPVLARPNTPLGRVVSRVAARSGTCARPPRAGQLRYVHPCAQSGTCARSPLRPLRPAPPRHLVRDLPWGEEGGVCTAPAVAGGRFCRNLRIRTRAPLGRVRVQVPDLRRHWVYKVPGGVGAALILRLRHAHETGPADKWQTTQRSA